jgi:hypothetical protein
LARLFKKSYLKNEKELGHSENGCWRIVVAIYTPGSSIFFTLAILNGKSPSVRMSDVGVKTKPAVDLLLLLCMHKPVPLIQGGLRTPKDLRRRTAITPVKDSHTRIIPLTLASGHYGWVGLI